MKGGTQDMSGFIEQFYYGNIEPQARGISTNKTGSMSIVGVNPKKKK